VTENFFHVVEKSRITDEQVSALRLETVYSFIVKCTHRYQATKKRKETETVYLQHGKSISNIETGQRLGKTFHLLLFQRCLQTLHR